jgi:MipA family protein
MGVVSAQRQMTRGATVALRTGRRVRIGRLLALLLAAGAFTGAEAREISRLAADEGPGVWGIGIGVRAQSFPYHGQTRTYDVVPLITYRGERVYFEGTRMGVRVFDDGRWDVSAFAGYRFSPYYENYSDALEGMSRDDTVEAGLRLARRTAFGEWFLEAAGDPLDRHEGTSAEFGWTHPFETGRWAFAPRLAVELQDARLANYDFAVRPDEARAERPAYDVGSTVNLRYGAEVEYRLTRRQVAGINVEQVRYDKAIARSPIVDRRMPVNAFLSYRYEFHEGPDPAPPAPEPLDEKWFLRLAGGFFASSGLTRILRGKFDLDDERMGLASIFAGRRISETFFRLPVEVYVKAGYARHFERGRQPNFSQYVLAIKGYYSGFPWSHRLDTRVGIANGLSYVSRIPVLEREDVGRDASHLLNYIDMSLDVNLGDLTGAQRLSRCYGGFSLHHRSGIFSNAEVFGNVSGGSNYNTLYVECQRGRR